MADLRFAERLKREKMPAEVTGEPFGVPAPIAPPRRAAAARAPAAPVAIAFPYRYAGQISLPGGETQVYLTKGGELLLVKAGDMLEGAFRVTSVGEESLEVLHLASHVSTLLQYSSLSGEPAAALRARRRVAAAQ